MARKRKPSRGAARGGVNRKPLKVTPEKAGEPISPDQVELETGNDLPPIEMWQKEIEAAKKQNEEWWGITKRIVERYKDERISTTFGALPKGNDERRYNVLWASVETMKPLVYNRPPTPYLSRRYDDRDPVARDGSMLLERAIKYTIECDDLHHSLEEARDDYLLSSRGVIWFKYSPYLALRESELKTYVDEAGEDELEDVDDDDIKEDDDGRQYFHKKYEEKVDEEITVEHVNYCDFLHGAAAKWQFVPWVARRVPMTRRELIKRFGSKMGALPPLTMRTETDAKIKNKEEGDESKSLFGKAEIWEIWDKSTRKVLWLCPAVKDTFLDVKDDILDLEGFFPCPRPVYATKTNDSLIPTPDFKVWQDCAFEIDEITYRIMLLTKALRVVGVYNKQAGDTIKRIVTQTRDNDLIPVDNWALFAEQGGLKGAVDWVDITVVAAVLDKLYTAREALIKELYELTGLSDIVRGATDPRETAMAQSTKAGFANKRLTARQDAIARMAREGMEIIAEIISKHYSEDTIKKITSAQQLMRNQNTGLFDVLRFKTAMDLIRNSPLRRYRIKVDERNLAMADDVQERADRAQFLQSVSQFMQGALPMLQSYPMTAPMLGELLMFGVRGFNMARSVESAIESAILQLTSTPQQDQQNQPQAQDQKAQGKTGPELMLDAQKNQIAQGHLDLAVKKHEDQMAFQQGEQQIKLMEIQMHKERGQQDAMLRQAKIASDEVTKQKQLGIQAAGLQNQAAMDQQRLQRDLTNDHHSMVLAFTRPPATQQGPSTGTRH
jgi:hypothetical protein